MSIAGDLRHKELTATALLPGSTWLAAGIHLHGHHDLPLRTSMSAPNM